MTYLLARPFTSDPFLEVWECENQDAVPKLVGVKPPFYAKVDNIRFSGDNKTMVSVTSYLREAIPGLGSPDDPTENAAKAWFSDDDQFILVSKPRALYKRQGPYYVAVPESDFPWGSSPATEVISFASISKDANVICVVLPSEQNTIIVYDRVEGTDSWQRKVGLSAIGVTQPEVTITPDSKYIFSTSSAATSARKIFRLVGTNYEPIGQATSNFIRCAHWFADGRLRIFTSSNTVFDILDGVYTQIGGTVPANLPSASTQRHWQFAHDGQTIWRGFTATAAGTASARFLAGAYLKDNVWTNIAGIPIVNANTNWPTSATYLTFNKAQTEAYMIVNMSGTSSVDNFFALTISVVDGVYTVTERARLAVTIPGVFSADASMSEDDAIFHATGLHILVAAPQLLTEVPELPGVPASTIRRFDFSPSKQAAVIYVTTIKPVVITRDGRGQYLDARTLQGTFVTVYDRDDQSDADVKPFRQRDMIQHILNTKISDIVFAPQGKALSYHASNPGNAEASGLGRFVYDLQSESRIIFRSVLWTSGDEQSLAAYQPEGQYLAVTYRNQAAGNTIKLYQIANDQTATLRDSRVVAYGPVAYSKCETIVVAHGGPEPYSLFSHTFVPDVLVAVPLPDIEWSTDSQILGLLFTDDCAAVVIVTPGQIVVIDVDDGTTEDEAPEGPGEPSPESPIIVQPDGGDTIIVDPVQPPPGGDDNPGEPGTSPPTWTVDTPSKGISGVKFIPYVAINVSYRTR